MCIIYSTLMENFFSWTPNTKFQNDGRVSSSSGSYQYIHLAPLNTMGRLEKFSNFFFFTLFFYLFIYFWIIFFFLICSEFCHTLKWNVLEFTCLPHPDPPSHLPLHPLPPGLPRALIESENVVHLLSVRLL